VQRVYPSLAVTVLFVTAHPAMAAPRFLNRNNGVLSPRTVVTAPDPATTAQQQKLQSLRERLQNLDRQPPPGIQPQALQALREALAAELRAAEARAQEPKDSRFFLFGPVLEDADDGLALGVGVGLQDETNAQHPFEVGLTYARRNTPGTSNNSIFVVEGAYTLWKDPAEDRWDEEGRPWRRKRPVLALAGTLEDEQHTERRWEVGLVLEQPVKRLKLLANLLYADLDADDGGGGSAIVPAVGVEYIVSDRLVLTAGYILDNAADGEDDWAVSGIYAINETSELNIGAEKHGVITATLTFKSPLRWR
jgi:hypothetical protein